MRNYGNNPLYPLSLRERFKERGLIFKGEGDANTWDNTKLSEENCCEEINER